MAASTTAAPSAAATAASAQAANDNARALLLAQAINTRIKIASGTVAGATGPGTVVPIGPPQIRMFGLLKRFLLRISFTVTAPGGQTQTLGPFGPSTAISQVVFSDTNNYERHRTSGIHLNLVSTAKRRRVYGAAFTSDSPNGFGNNWQALMAAPASIGAGATGDVDLWLEIPVSYTDMDLRGAIWLGVTQATLALSFQFNPNMFANTGTTDTTQALYVSAGGTSATMGDATWVLYQDTLDQVPRVPAGSQGAGAPILPWQDIGTNYMLQTTPGSGGLVANTDNPFPYANFRNFLSTMAIFDNGGVLNTGSDVTRLAIQTANTVNIIDIDPPMAAFETRLLFGDDPPPGMYYFDHRHRPIWTQQYGNMALLFNPNLVNAGASLILGYEMLAQASLITGAGSLPGT